jgi:hypothetical protein
MYQPDVILLPCWLIFYNYNWLDFLSSDQIINVSYSSRGSVAIASAMWDEQVSPNVSIIKATVKLKLMCFPHFSPILSILNQHFFSQLSFLLQFSKIMTPAKYIFSLGFYVAAIGFAVLASTERIRLNSIRIKHCEYILASSKILFKGIIIQVYQLSY